MTRVNKGRLDSTLKRRALLEKLIRDEGLAPQVRHSIPLREDRASAPLSFAQRRLWFINQLEPGNPAYNEHFALRLTGSINISALQQAINEIVRRHESLRTTFRVMNQEPTQIIADLELEVAVANLEAITGSQSTESVLDLVIAEARRPFHLEHGPLVRMTLLRLAEGDSQLLFTIHHVVSDGWSAGILVKELASIYPALLDGLPSALAELTVQYGDFAMWQEQWLRENVLAAQLPYWRQKMAGAPATLDLRVGNSRPTVQRHRGASQPLHFSRELSRKIRSYSRQTRSTVFMVLLTAFKALLYRYSEQRDIVLATPVAGRNREELEGLIGFFANTLLLRTEIAEGGGFEGLLSSVKDTAISALAHQDVPFEILVEELNPERDLSYNPLCQVLFVLQDAPPQEFTLPGLTVEPLRTSAGAAKFDLTLDISDTGEELSGFLEYNTDLFDGSTIQRMAGHFINLLNAAAEDPSRGLRDLPLLSEPERHQLQVEWNGARVVNNDARCIHELFESQAERAPDSIALVDEQQQLSYSEVNRRANQLGHFLRSAGVGPEVKVALCLERTVELVVAILGVFKAGGAYVPLDPAYPRERLEFMMEDGEVEILLVQHQLVEKLPRHGARTIEVDGDRESIAKHNDNNFSDVAEPRNLAYVIYTSGSTGRPKGVAIEHRSVATFIAWALEVFGREELAGVLFSTSICFDLSVFEMFVPLACGGKVILAESALQLPRLKAAHSVTLLNTVPSAMTELIRGGAVPASVRTVNLAGEPLKLSLAQRINKRESIQRLFNLYGPSEDTTYSTWSLLGSQIETAPGIGRPIANTQVYITDTALQVVPAAVPGELYIGGDGLARGYLNRPDLTADRFIPDSFGEAAGERLYRTGDQGRYRADGEIEFLGRQDHQVKVRGFRIELGEIEAALIGCKNIREAIVIVEGEEVETRLIAYYVAEGERTEDISELRRQLREKLPDYMIPSVFVEIEQMPLTANGKVDRRALPRLSREDAQDPTVYEQPQTETEETLAGLWAAVLKLDRVGRNDNFFEIGGHSLLGARVISRVREVFRVELPLRNLFESPTLKELSSRIEQGLSDGSQIADRPIARAVRGRAPASFAQERLWFLDQMETAGSAYHMAGVVRLRGHVDVASLWSSLAGVVGRHEVLRTNFVSEDGQLVQIIANNERVHKVVIDLSQLSDDKQRESAERLMRIEAERPFNLATDPLIRAYLLKLSEQEHLLELVIHHIVSDGWSLGILIREISAQYGAFLKGQQSPLSEPPIQYADYAAWQRKQLKGGLLEKQLSYWRDQLCGAPVLELPTSRVRPRVQSIAGAKERMTIPADLTRRLKELSRQEGLTLFMTLLGSFQLLLMRWSGQTDVTVGTPVAGRTRGEVEELIGLFVNTVALRARLVGGESVREMLRRVREVTLQAYANQDAPFEILVEQLQPVRDLSYTPLIQVFFNMLNMPDPAIELAELSIEPEAPPEAGSKFDLTLYTREQDDELDCALVYNTDLFDRSRMIEFLDQFQHLLLQIVDDPNREVAGLSLVTPRVEGLLPNPYEQLNSICDETVVTRFASQARIAPKRVAVIGPRDAWTYREIDTRSNQLANCLLKSGITSQEVVAVYGCRSGSLLWAVLGILKAGAAFVILDHSYPAARLTDYLARAKPAGLICLQEAGNLPDTLRDYVETKSYRCWLELPGLANAVKDGALMSYSGESPNVRVAPEDLAYIAFTSGSTGEPRAVAGDHGPLAHFLRWHSSTFKLGETDRFSMLSGLAHDPLLRDVFSPLWLGATLCIPAQDDIETPGHLSAWMRREEITVAHLAPAMGQILTGSEIERDYTLGCLGYVFMGGDALTTQLVSRLRRLAPSVKCVNFYGATETPQAMGYFVVPADEDAGKQQLLGLDRVVPIGRGIEDVQLLVLNSSRQLCGVCELGEIYIRTPFLARGYLADAELTAERFITNPFTQAEGDRLYRTGDLGRYSPEGFVEYCGRLDQQLKIRGFRIDPTEIEITLCRHPQVSKTVVMARADDAGEKRLVAYVVARGKSAVSIGEMRAHLQERLPDFMVPTTFLIVDEVPLTPNGKVDKCALAARPLTIDANLAGGYVAPRTTTEQILSGVWSELLGLERVGTRDNFFELGGHSLLTMRVALRVRREFGVEMPVRTLFERPTIAELADLIEQELGKGNAAPLPVLRRISRESEVPLSFAQERIYVLQQMEPESSFFNVHQTFRLKGGLDVPALTSGLNEVVRRHEALRTSFEIKGGRAVQVIADRLCIDVPVVDLSHLTEDDRQVQLQELASRQSRRAFDLTEVPLLRVSLLQLSDGDHVVLLTVHHIISDGWSVGLLIREVAELYEAFSTGSASSLPEVDIQYADVAGWQREWMRGEVLDQQLAYWKDKLADAPPMLDLPTDYPRPPVRTQLGARHVVTLPASLVAELAETDRQYGSTLFITMLTALKIVMFRWTGQQDIVVGTVTANRNSIETETLIGCFMNFSALRSQVSGDETGLELLNQIKANVFEMYAHQDCPFESVVEAVKPERKPHQNPLFNVALLVQNFPRNYTFSESLEAGIVETDDHPSLLDLRLVAEEYGDSIKLWCEYSTDLFVEETIQNFVEWYCDTLSRLVREPEAKLSSFELDVDLEVSARRSRARDQKQVIAIASTFTAEPVEAAISFWMERLGIPAQCEFAPYNQVFQQLLDPSSLLSRNQNGVNVVLVCLEDWGRYASQEEARGVAPISVEDLDRNAANLAEAIKRAAGSGTPCLLCMCPASPGAMDDVDRATSFLQAEELIASELAAVSGAYVVTTSEIAATYPVSSYYDAHSDNLGHIPYTPAFFTALGTTVARKIQAIRQPPYKVVVLDCDDTLWGGICGEDGAGGVVIDASQSALQEFVVRQHDEGMLVCLCSKNNEEDVLEVFKTRSEMVLRREHLAAWRINWGPKSENIKSLAAELMLGLDAFIFIDNDPVVCLEVQTICPEVLTLQLPAEAGRVPGFLRHVWAFDRLKLTEEDRKRTALYRQDKHRYELRNASLSLDDFIATIELKVSISQMRTEDLARVAQLTRRTNQFNFTGRERSESEIQRLLRDGHECLVVEVRDRFGEYGLVGVMIFQKAAFGLQVDTFLLSCRALGRNVECHMLAKLGAIALGQRLSRIDIPFFTTKRNQPALDFLQRVGVGFKRRRPGGWILEFPAEHAASLVSDRNDEKQPACAPSARGELTQQI